MIIQAVLAAEAAAKAEEAQRLKDEKLKESRRFFPRILGALGLRKVGGYLYNDMQCHCRSLLLLLLNYTVRVYSTRAVYTCA